MKQKEHPSRVLFQIFNYAFMLLIAFVTLAPMLHVLFASFSDPIKLAQHEGIILWPLGFTFKGYQIVFKNPSLLNGYANTIFYVVLGTALSVMLTAMGAYGLSRKKLLWRNWIMGIVTITMFFNGGLIPTYMVVKYLGMINTRWAVIIPMAISVFNLIIMRTSFLEIPDSLEESAKIDGASDITILFKIIIPLSKAVMAVIALFYAVQMWNSWFQAMIYLRDRKLYPLQVILREILVQNDQSSVTYDSSMAGNLDLYKALVKYTTIIVATAPILAIYPFVQKYFVTGVMIGSIKG
ncbi:MAG: carbohydrate ABC transporter permease [Clostridiales bacterium]|nr:carbohydrate ABC transporter permease [Clostridiales bacterium]